MDTKQFGQFLSEERKAKRMTQKELADRLGVTDKAISKWERGVCLPDVAKFDDIAAALDLTDIEVLRAHRLPPEPAPEKTPPFVTWRELGTLALGWAVLMAALFGWELLEIGRAVQVVGLGMMLRPLLAAVFAARLALRRAQDVSRIDWRGVCVYGLLCVVLFLAFVVCEEGYGLFWPLEQLRRAFGADIPNPAAWAYFYQGGIRWEPRWMAYWFLALCYFDVWPWAALAAALGVYPLVKLLKIRRNQKKERDNRKNVCYTEENS